MDLVDKVQVGASSLLVLGIIGVMARAVGKQFSDSLTRQVDTKQELLRRLRNRP
jgi:hypothetical protein